MPLCESLRLDYKGNKRGLSYLITLDKSGPNHLRKENTGIAFHSRIVNRKNSHKD